MDGKSYTTVFGEFVSGETVVIFTDGQIEPAVFVKVSGSGSVVVRIANGREIALQGADRMAKRFAISDIAPVPVG